MDPHDYNITVRQVHEEDGPCFEARVRELPDVAEYADTFQEAYELAIDTIATTAEALAEQGKRMPAPAMVNDEYSGRITVRVPRNLHRELAEAAEKENVSLNQLIAGALGVYVGVRGVLTPAAAFLPQYTAFSDESIAVAGNAQRRPGTPQLRVVRDNNMQMEADWGNTG
ncbi:hypothetical protein HH1059_04410 [Halorhodospira halochloris]|uniref:Toxin-antitoxin system HicB family antitoxin n=1 Tax=Halorhodospira halochloris TaxID=1052 RepID=A0A0X8XBS9_HALHR|nr:toxin-antitoxin system HicB family antitoxin [Halorhodospira halochloris]MBK1652931.1 hypothetical protein [Halorhodospira halochloris]MCG5549474.1 type II toxin-antitoxin system HicB family antitoxin [Halorhodospira halochloris]BAU57114.1 hypothetical protein HH1059_04410 [Halorhodospira halochloris]